MEMSSFLLAPIIELSLPDSEEFNVYLMFYDKVSESGLGGMSESRRNGSAKFL